MSAQRSNLLTSGIVLAGTFPWANSAFDRLSPRPLVPVAQRPLIAYSLMWLQAGGIQHVAVCSNRNSRALQDKVRRQFSSDLDLTYLEDPMPRGAAGCIRDAALASDSQTLVVTDGAAIPTSIDVHALLEAHAASGAAVTVVVYHEPRAVGHTPLQVPAGIYVLDRAALEPVAKHGFVDIKEHLIPSLVRAGKRIVTFAVHDEVPRVLNAETYLAANEFATQRLTIDSLPPGYVMHGEAIVHETAVVGPDVRFVGPVAIGEGSSIESGAILVGPTSIGQDVRIGAGALVSRSAIWRRARILNNAAVDRSIIADDGVVESDGRAYREVVSGGKDRISTAILRSGTQAIDRVTDEIESAARKLLLWER